MNDGKLWPRGAVPTRRISPLKRSSASSKRSRIIRGRVCSARGQAEGSRRIGTRYNAHGSCDDEQTRVTPLSVALEACGALRLSVASRLPRSSWSPVSWRGALERSGKYLPHAEPSASNLFGRSHTEQLRRNPSNFCLSLFLADFGLCTYLPLPPANLVHLRAVETVARRARHVA